MIVTLDEISITLSNIPGRKESTIKRAEYTDLITISDALQKIFPGAR